MVEFTRHMGLLCYSRWKWPGNEVSDVIGADSDQVSGAWPYLRWQRPGKQMSDNFPGNSSKTECSLVSAPHCRPNRTTPSPRAHPWKKWVIFLDWKLSKLKRESRLWAAEQTHSKSGRWQLERTAHIFARFVLEIVRQGYGVRWGCMALSVTVFCGDCCLAGRHWERGSGYIRGVAAGTGAEGGWNVLTGRPALEETIVTAMHPDGGIIYQTPPGRKNTVCRWLGGGRLALHVLYWVVVKDSVCTAQ